MQIVIEISEQIYKQSCVLADIDGSPILKAIKNGTPLSKGHGRLIDADAFLSKVKADRKHSAYVRSWTADDVLNVLNNSYTPTIIEADKVESEK